MHSPPVLYKYTTSSTALIVLGTGKLRWSSPRLFNDPAEFQRLPRFEPSLKDALAVLPKVIVGAAAGEPGIETGRLHGLARQMYDLVKFALSQGMTADDFLKEMEDQPEDPDSAYSELLRNFFGDNFITQARVMCLTANHSNPAMWANYAEQHAGCLLGFRHLPEHSTPFTEARAVDYYKEPPVVCSGLDFFLYGDTKQIREATIDAVCFAKRIEWQYEQEWRVVTWRSNEGVALSGDYPFLPGELESVTFGLRTSEETKRQLLELVANYPNCNLYQIEHKHGELRRCGV